MPRRRTTADEIRALRDKHPDLSQAELARRVGTSRSAVHAALKTCAPWGRAPLSTTTITLRVRRDLLDYARRAARGRGGAKLARVLERALEAQLVPAGEKALYERKRGSEALAAKKRRAPSKSAKKKT